MNGNQEFGLHLKAWRRAKFTQQELADQIGVTRTTVTRWETGLFEEIRPSNLRAMSDALGVGEELINTYRACVEARVEA